MAALKPYQSALLENRDILLRDIRTDEVCPLLYEREVLTLQEVKGVDIGRNPHERAESLLDLLHYKGPNGFHELVIALEDTNPHLAAKLKAKNPQVEVLGELLKLRQRQFKKTCSTRLQEHWACKVRAFRE